MSEESVGIVITFGTEKGGAGKSTCATNTAVEFARRGYRVLLIDADKQRTSAKWAERREDVDYDGMPQIDCIEKLGKIKNTVLRQARNYDVVIVDPAGRDSAELRSALLASDRLYIPTQVSQFDLETMDDTIALYQEVKEYNEDLQAYTLLTQAPTEFGGKELKESREYLKDFIEVAPLARSIIKSRKIYRTTPRAGLGVVETTNSQAKAEIQLLVQEIIKHASE